MPSVYSCLLFAAYCITFHICSDNVVGFALAATAKATKKLRKLQGIACDTEQAHSSVIVDASLLQDDTSSEGQNSSPACTTAAYAAGATASRESSGSKRSTKQKAGSYVPSSIAGG